MGTFIDFKSLFVRFKYRFGFNRDFESVEQIKDLENDDGSDIYYELYYGLLNTNSVRRQNNSTAAPPKTGLGFRETQCSSKSVVKVSCQQLQCGVAPRSFTQAARYRRLI